MCFKKDVNLLLLDEFQPSELSKYKDVERFFQLYNIQYQINFRFENKMFDYAFLYKSKIHLVDVYFSYNDDFQFERKILWCYSNNLKYHVIPKNGSCDVLEKNVIYKS
jgi:hypothetical protein